MICHNDGEVLVPYASWYIAWISNQFSPTSSFQLRINSESRLIRSVFYLICSSSNLLKCRSNEKVRFLEFSYLRKNLQTKIANIQLEWLYCYGEIFQLISLTCLPSSYRSLFKNIFYSTFYRFYPFSRVLYQKSRRIPLPIHLLLLSQFPPIFLDEKNILLIKSILRTF